MSEWNERFPNAFVSRQAVLGDDVEIGPGTVVHPRVRLGSRCRIGPYCVIGEAGAEIGDDVTIEGYCVSERTLARDCSSARSPMCRATAPSVITSGRTPTSTSATPR